MTFSLILVSRVGFAVGHIKGDLDGLLEGLVDIKVMPLLGGGLIHADQSMLLPRVLELLSRHNLILVLIHVTEVLLCGDEHDGCVLHLTTDLSLPLLDVAERGLIHSTAA